MDEVDGLRVERGGDGVWMKDSGSGSERGSSTSVSTMIDSVLGDRFERLLLLRFEERRRTDDGVNGLPQEDKNDFISDSGSKEGIDSVETVRMGDRSPSPSKLSTLEFLDSFSGSGGKDSKISIFGSPAERGDSVGNITGGDWRHSAISSSLDMRVKVG